MKRKGATPPLHFESRLIEEVVFRVIHTGQVERRLAARIHRRRSRVYDLPANEDRDVAFAKVSMAVFRDLGLARVFQQTLGEFPPLFALAEMRVLTARSRKEEHAELYVRGDKRTPSHTRRGVVWVLVRRFLEHDAMQHFLRREFLHLSDMLDEQFAYRRDSIPQEYSLAAQNLFRDRYRLLWELSVAGRLERRRKMPEGTSDALRSDFDRVFGTLETDQREEIFCRVKNDVCPTHAMLVALTDCSSGTTADDSRLGRSQASGACPICRFPTFDWVETPKSIVPDMQETIRESVTAWQPEDGICRRCYELFEFRMHDSIVNPQEETTSKLEPV